MTAILGWSPPIDTSDNNGVLPDLAGRTAVFFGRQAIEHPEIVLANQLHRQPLGRTGSYLFHDPVAGLNDIADLLFQILPRGRNLEFPP